MGSDGKSAQALYAFLDAEALAEDQAQEGELGDADIVQWLKLGRAELVIAALAHWSTFLVIAVRTFYAADYQAALFLARAADLSWPTFLLLLHAKSSSPIPTFQRLLGASPNLTNAMSTPTATRSVEVPSIAIDADSRRAAMESAHTQRIH